MRKPQCTIFAGPNGSGKTSIYDKMRNDIPGMFINADQIASRIHPHRPPEPDRPSGASPAAARTRAGRMAIAEIDRHIAERRDFAFETTLSSQHSIGVMRRARQAGFDVGLIYVILDSPQRHIERVQFRVELGGHPIPDADVVRRYDKSLRNLPSALTLADETVIIDNSTIEPIYLFELRRGLIVSDYDGAIALHRRLLEIVQSVIGDR
jgi:predicted ABC-type ATPase